MRILWCISYNPIVFELFISKSFTVIVRQVNHRFLPRDACGTDCRLVSVVRPSVRHIRVQYPKQSDTDIVKHLSPPENRIGHPVLPNSKTNPVTASVEYTEFFSIFGRNLSRKRWLIYCYLVIPEMSTR